MEEDPIRRFHHTEEASSLAFLCVRVVHGSKFDLDFLESAQENVKIKLAREFTS